MLSSVDPPPSPGDGGGVVAAEGDLQQGDGHQAPGGRPAPVDVAVVLPVPGVGQHLRGNHRVEGAETRGLPPCPHPSLSPVNGTGEARRPLARHHVHELLEGDG